MKIVKCPKCKIKLGEIDEKDYSVIFEKGVEPIRPNLVENELLTYEFICPNCNKRYIEALVINNKERK